MSKTVFKQVDPALNLVKGRGGAHLREKMVEMCADKFIVIVDESKLVKELGVGAFPVEVCYVDLKFSSRASLPTRFCVCIAGFSSGHTILLATSPEATGGCRVF